MLGHYQIVIVKYAHRVTQCHSNQR